MLGIFDHIIACVYDCIVDINANGDVDGDTKIVNTTRLFSLKQKGLRKCNHFTRFVIKAMLQRWL